MTETRFANLEELNLGDPTGLCVIYGDVTYRGGVTICLDTNSFDATRFRTG
jgi:hypothetical protein